MSIILVQYAFTEPVMNHYFQQGQTIKITMSSTKIVQPISLAEAIIRILQRFQILQLYYALAQQLLQQPRNTPLIMQNNIHTCSLAA